MAPAANHGWYMPVFYWLHETAACCYFGVDLRNGHDHKSLSRLADGTPYSSSDLHYFTLLLYLDKIILLPNLSSLSLSSLDKKLLSPTSILQKFSKTISNSVLVANHSNSTKIF